MAGRAFLLLFFVPLFIGGILYCIVRVQLFLSRSHSRWPGLILPGLSLLLSLMPLLIMVFWGVASQTAQTTQATIAWHDISDSSDVVFIQKEGIVHHMIDHGIIRLEGSFFGYVFLFLLANIPTVILLAIYAVCRDKMRKQKEIQFMNVQDL